VNAGGSGEDSPDGLANTTAGAPLGLAQTQAGTASAVVGFTLPGDATTDIQYSTDNGATWCGFGAPRTQGPLRIDRRTNATCTGTALVPRTTYQVRLRPVSGTGPWSVGSPSAPLAVTTLPAAPTNLARSAATASALTVTFTSPTGTAPLTNSWYSTDNGATWCPFAPVDTTSPVVISRVSAGGCAGAALQANRTYAVRLAAGVASGRGTASATLSATTVPGPPTGITGKVGTKSVALTWVAPSTAGGLPVTDYVVQHSRNNSTWTTVADGVSSNRAANVTGLVAGARYWFRVAAKTTAGQSTFTSTAPTTYAPR